MFRNWLKASSYHANLSAFRSDQLGRNLLHFQDVQSLKGCKVALIGMGRNMDRIRKYLYGLSFPFESASIMDMGNLRKSEVEFAIPLLRELLAGKIFPLVLSEDPALSTATYHAFRSERPLISLASVAERFFFDEAHKIGPYYFNDIIMADGFESQLFHFAAIGSQAHFISPDQLSYVQKRNFDHLSLGKARANLKEVEPYIRDADIINFHLDVLKQSEAPGVMDSSPGGFTHEEACQIMRYAGMSDKLRTLGIYGYHRDNDINDFTAKVTAQLAWYFLDGFFNRKKDFPVSVEDLVEYIVDSKNLNHQMVFFKSNKSGRWWMRVPVKVKGKYERHGLIPCSYLDYEMACKDEFPERLLKAFQRFT